MTLFGLSLVLSLIGCRSDDEPQKHPSEGEGEGEGEGEAAPETWTFAVFMDGDNDLETYVPHDLNELEIAGSTDYANVVVQADRIDGYEDGDGDWTDTRRYFITPDGDLENVGSEVVEELGEVDMGDPAVLSDFLMWAEENYPADHLALVLWDHGDGWMMRATDVQGAVSWDETSGNDISIAGGELAEALVEITETRGKLDVIAFDACNMAAWEPAHYLAPYADYLVASEATVGDEGLQYGAALKLLRDQVPTSARELAQNLAYWPVAQGGEWTYSAMDLGQIEAVSAAVDALAAAALASDEGMEALELVRHDAQAVDLNWHDWYIDLGDVAAVASASEVQDIAAAGAQLSTALEAATVWAGGNEPLTWTSGMYIYMDTSDADYLELYAYGDASSWAEDTLWDDALLEIAASEGVTVSY